MPFLREDWTAIRVTNPALQFIYERWLESLHPGSSVSQHAPVMGALGLLREAIRLSEEYRGSDYGSFSTRSVEEEAFGVEVNPFGKVRGTIPTDPAVRQAEVAVEDLRHANRRHFISGGASDALREHRDEAAIRHLLAKLEPHYLHTLAERIEYLVFDSGEATPGTFEELDDLITALAAEVLGLGFADSFLRFHQRTLEDRSGRHGSQRERLQRFLRRLQRPPSSVHVIFNVQANKDFWERWPSGTYRIAESLEEFEDVDAANVEPDYRKTGPLYRFVAFELTAYDHHAASRRAYAVFQRIADVVLAELGKGTPVLHSCITVWRGSRGTTTSAADKSQLQLEPIPVRTRTAERDFTGFARDFVSISAPESALRRLEGALRFYRISLESSWLESGLTNLWTALEVLSSQRLQIPIIERVTNSIAPLVGSYKVKSLADDLVGYLVQARVFDEAGFATVYSDILDDEGRIDPIRAIGILSDETRSEQLIADFVASPLLAHRVRSFNKKLETGKELAHVVYRTTRRVEWQIRRLYRLRNEMVHGAVTPPNGQRILQHLQLYTNHALLTVFDLIGAENGLDTIEDVVAAVDSGFHAWLQWIRTLGELRESAPEAWERLYTPPFARISG